MAELIITLPYTIGDAAFLIANNVVLEDSIIEIDIQLTSATDPEDNAIYILETSGRKTASQFYASKAALLASL